MKPGQAIKDFVKDFPHQGGMTVLSFALIGAFGAVVTVRFALGKIFPDGYEGWLIFLGTIAGVTTGGMIGKRATDFRYKAAGTNAATVVQSEETTVVGSPVEVKKTPATPPVEPEGG